MKKVFLAFLIGLLVLGVVSFLRLVVPTGNININGNIVINNNNNNSSIISGSNTTGLTLAELNMHDKQNDCWVGYNGKVYDITSWLPRHPGSAAAIAPYCGTYDEFTRAFTRQHGTSKVSLLMRVGTLIGDFQIRGNV